MPETPCWEWPLARTGGYGVKVTNGKRHQAHRLLYETLIGPIPAGMQLDHLCRNPGCVRPDHLEPVTNRENTKRGIKGDLKTHCAQGHPWTAENIYIRPGNGRRMCRVCMNVRHLERAAREKNAAYRRLFGRTPAPEHPGVG